MSFVDKIFKSKHLNNAKDTMENGVKRIGHEIDEHIISNLKLVSKPHLAGLSFRNKVNEIVIGSNYPSF